MEIKNVNNTKIQDESAEAEAAVALETSSTEENDTTNAEQAVIARPKGLSPGRQVLIRFFRSKLSVVGLVILLTLFAFSFFGPIFSRWDETTQDYSGGKSSYLQVPLEVSDEEGNVYIVWNVIQTEKTLNDKALPSMDHLFGTDENGRDVFTRLMYGGRISLTIGFVVIFAEAFIGIILGGLAGYFGKWVDQLIMRIVDIFQCIPMLPILLIASVVISSLGIPQQSRIYYLMLIMTFFGWSGIARMVRGQILSLREQDYMTAAESIGLSAPRKIFKHLIPNVLPQLIVSMTLGLGGIILYESSLSFLGLGVPHPYATWGSMITAATQNTDVLEKFFHIWVPPGVCIVLAVLAFNFIGDGLRDAFDPRGRR